MPFRRDGASDVPVSHAAFEIFKTAGLTSFTFDDDLGDEEENNDGITRRKIHLKKIYEKIDCAIDKLRKSCKLIASGIHSSDDELRFIPDQFLCGECFSWFLDPVIVPGSELITCCRKCLVSRFLRDAPDCCVPGTKNYPSSESFVSNQDLAAAQSAYLESTMCVTGTSTYNIVVDPLDLTLETPD